MAAHSPCTHTGVECRCAAYCECRARNRLAGTIMGGAWGYCCIALAYAINGASYANTPLKYAIIALAVSAWGGFTAWGRRRCGPDVD